MRKTHGETVRKYIKYDEENCSLYQDLKLPDEPWLKITPGLASELRKEYENQDIARSRQKLTARSREESSVNYASLGIPQQRTLAKRSGPSLLPDSARPAKRGNVEKQEVAATASNRTSVH